MSFHEQQPLAPDQVSASSRHKALITLVTLGLALLVLAPLALLAVIGIIVTMVFAMVDASNGREHRYPLTLRLLR